MGRREEVAGGAGSLRAKIPLASADGKGVGEMARRLETSTATVCLWHRHHRRQGLAGLQTQPRAGRPRRITEAKERAAISATLRAPRAETHWSTPRLAKTVNLSPSTVHRIWQKHGLQPHRSDSFKFSREPEFDAKLADVVGLYLDPAERALVRRDHRARDPTGELRQRPPTRAPHPPVHRALERGRAALPLDQVCATHPKVDLPRQSNYGASR